MVTGSDYPSGIFKLCFILGPPKNMCVYGHPTDPISSAADPNLFYSTLIFASDPINFYTEFG
jgi:hypothetical protein